MKQKTNTVDNYDSELSIEDIVELILRNDIATFDELLLITNINGYSTETLNSIIYARTGYRDIIQFLESEETE